MLPCGSPLPGRVSRKIRRYSCHVQLSHIWRVRTLTNRMARCLLTTLWIAADDPLFAPLKADGHDIVPVDGIAVRSEPALIDALQGMAASLASTEPYTAAVLAEAPDLRVIS